MRAHPLEREARSPAAEPARRAIRRRRMLAALSLTLAVLVVEIVGGILSGSLALLADASHMFADVSALVLATAAMALAERSATRRYTFGFYRAEVLAAFVNAEILLGVSAMVLYEAYRRFAEPPEVQTGLMTAVAVVALGANLVSLKLLHDEQHDSLNIRAAYLEVLTDTLGSVAVLAAAVAMGWTGWYGIDAIASAGVALLVLPRSLSLLRHAAHILLEGTPVDVDLATLRRDILDLPGVEELHDLHFWTLTSGVHSASVHVRAAAESPRGQVLRAVQDILREKGVDHSTVQVEWGPELLCQIDPEHE